jgi:hypothetical protein
LSRLLVAVAVALPVVAHAQPAFLWWGEPDPTGADRAFLSLGRRRGALVAQETPGRVGGEPASAQLKRAVGDYQALKLPRAVEELDALEREIAPSGGGGLGQGELVDLYANRAAARMALGDEAAAWDDLLAVARLAPGRPLDPARFAPKLIEAARRAAQSVGTPVKLVVEVAPADSVVILDGQLLGRGRAEASVAPGAHLVRAERSGFRAAGQVVQVAPSGGEAKLTLSPAAAPDDAALARRGALAGASEVLAAWVESRDGRAVVTLARLDARDGRRLGRAEVGDDEHLDSSALAGAIDGLLTSGPAPTSERRPWYKRGWVWGVAGSVAAAALGVGLGVGLGVSHDSGTPARVDLGAAR